MKKKIKQKYGIKNNKDGDLNKVSKFRLELPEAFKKNAKSNETGNSNTNQLDQKIDFGFDDFDKVDSNDGGSKQQNTDNAFA